MVTLVLWQHVVFLCVSRTLFRMSLVMVVRRMMCRVRLVSQSHPAQHTTRVLVCVIKFVYLVGFTVET